MLNLKQLIIISNENQLESLKGKKILKNQVIMVTEMFLKTSCDDLFPDAKIIWYKDISTNHRSWYECLTDEIKIFERINDLQINQKFVFKEILDYNGHSFLDIDAVRYLSGHKNIIANLIYKLSVLESIITDLKPDNVFVYYPYSEWEEVADYVCKKNDIKIYYSKNHLFSQINTFKNNFDIIKILKNLNLLPFAVKLKNLYIVCKNYLSQMNQGPKFDFLLFSINTKYSDIILPLSRSLKNDNFDPLIIISSDSDYVNFLKAEGLEYRILETYLDLNILLTIYPIYDQIIMRFNKIKNCNEFIIKMQEICGTFIANRLIKEIEYSIIFSIFSLRNILIIKKIIRKHSSKLLFSTHFSENIINSLFIGAKEFKVPTIGLHRGTSICQPELSIFNGDKLLVSGEHSKDIFVSMGIELYKIIITGFPLFDGLLKKLKNKNVIESKIYEKFNISKGYTIVTYLTQSFGAKFGPQERENEIKMVFNAFKEFDGIFLIVKLHPTEEDTDVYQFLANKVGLKNYKIIREGNLLDDVLIASQIALTKNSTTGFNALIAGCKLIILNYNEEKNFFLESDVAIAVNNMEEIINTIENIIEGCSKELNPEKVKKFIIDHFYKLDGKSTERIKKVIYESINLR